MVAHVNLGALDHEEESGLASPQPRDGGLRHFGQARLLGRVTGRVCEKKIAQNVTQYIFFKLVHHMWPDEFVEKISQNVAQYIFFKLVIN
jgi:hypothetical protein